MQKDQEIATRVATCPKQREPFSITKFDSKPEADSSLETKKALFPHCEEITTIDLDCLKSVTFDSNKKEIDIKIPDSAITEVVKVTKCKYRKRQAETLDDSELQIICTGIPAKGTRKRRNSGSSVKNNSKTVHQKL